MAKTTPKTRSGKTRRGAKTADRGRLDGAIVAVLIAAMEANAHVSREEAWRAHHIIWSMRRFRGRSGEAVDRLIDGVRQRVADRGVDAVLRDAVRAVPAALRPALFAVAVDLVLADARLERAEKRFVNQLATDLGIEPRRADGLVRAIVTKNSI